MRAFAFHFFVDYNVHSLDHGTAVNAGNGDVGADGFMLLNFLPDAFCLTIGVSLAFYRLKSAILIMCSNFSIVKYFITSHKMVSTFKLHFHQLFLDLLFDREKFRISALHWTHARFIVELF